MALGEPESPGLGIPGQVQERATLQSDRGDETQARFIYQWTAGVTLLAGAFSSQNPYVAIWCEHHDDLLAELATGEFHAIQVKTYAAQGANWICSNVAFVDAVKKFAEHEVNYSAKIPQYIFFSNAKPYIPGATAKDEASLASSPVRVCQECVAAADEVSISAPYKKSFDSLVKSSGADPAIIFRVLRKLVFQLGVPLESFREHIGLVIGGIPDCKQFTLEWIEKARDDLLLLVGKASTLDVPALEFYTSILQSDGRPKATLCSKRISVEEFGVVLKQTSSGGFRYPEVGGYLQLGKASGQKDVLRQKMTAGFVGGFFDSIWLQAMGAEQRLMERAHQNPESALKVIKQLEGVMLVECQNAEAAAALEFDERRRGIMIYQRILARTDELSRYEKESVESEPPQTLRGVAGLLSGSCKFAWGVPPELGGEDGP